MDFLFKRFELEREHAGRRIGGQAFIDPRGNVLGRGYWSPGSAIPVRMDNERKKEMPSVAMCLVIDRSARDVYVDGRPVLLTAKEFSLLVFLCDHRGKVKTREQLLSRVWGASYEGGARTVDIHVRRLRAKLGPAFPLKTLRGAGYKLALHDDHTFSA